MFLQMHTNISSMTGVMLLFYYSGVDETRYMKISTIYNKV